MTRIPTYNSPISFESEPFEAIAGGRIARQSSLSQVSYPPSRGSSGFDMEPTSGLLVIYGDGTVPSISEVSFVDVESFCDALTHRTSQALENLNILIPTYVISEIVNNFIFANFQDAIISISNGGQTISFSDHGPGIQDVGQSMRVGFSSATAFHRRYIRGAGAGFEVVSMFLRDCGGSLFVEDNIGGGTVVTLQLASMPGPPHTSPRGKDVYHALPNEFSEVDPARAATIFLNQRQREVLDVASRYSEVGPQLVSDILGIALSTAYRDLTMLENHSFISIKPNGKRVITEAGLSITTKKDPVYDY